MLHIDLETRSRTNLLTDGVYNYATDPSTQIICMAWAFGNGEINTWTPDMLFPAALEGYMSDGVPLYAHNAAFERLMFAYILGPDHGAPDVPLEQWHCTAFQAQCNNLPRSLFNAARSLGVKHQKDRAGRNLIAMLCIPQDDGTFFEDLKLLDEMIEYCAQDVRAEREISQHMREPTPDEWADYWTSEIINDNGVRVDMDLCVAAQNYATIEERELVGRIEEETAGEVVKARGEKLKAWVMERLTPDQCEVLKVYRKGEKKYSLDKHNRGRLLDFADLDPVVREVVECSDAAQKSSVGKFRALERRADPEDHRVRGAFVANGASQSGRYSSWGAQVHNFPRYVMPDPLEVRLDLVEDIEPDDMTDYYERPIMAILSGMLRPALIPADGCVFLVSDWSAIEGRVAPWLADSPAGEAKLQLYRNETDTYKLAASTVYSVDYDDVTDAQRQVGKVAELALQFGGGAGAFMGMARGYGVSVDKGEAEMIKERWRRANPWAPALWKGCEGAAMRAIRDPGTRYNVGRLSYFAMESVLIGRHTLFCELPCGRLLTYPDARIEQRQTPWGEMKPAITAMRAAWTPKATEREWPRAALWGGLLTENVVQGTAASMLRYALRAAVAEGLAVVLHVHDELVIETLQQHTGSQADVLEHIMNTAPAWAKGLPLKADVIEMERFGK